VRVGPNWPLGARSDSVNEALNGRSVSSQLEAGRPYSSSGLPLTGVVIPAQDDLKIDGIVWVGLPLDVG
jgi:hypothetical protein